MKLMKQKSVALLALCALGLVGCGGTTESGEGEAVTIVWWNNYQTPDPSKPEEENRKNSNYKEYYFAADLIKEYEAQNKNVKVSMEYKGSYNDIATAIKSGMEVGNLPTFASTYQDNVATYVANDVSYDMTELAKELEADKDFNANYLAIEKSTYGGHYYSLPYSKSAETLMVNQSVFDLEGAGKAGNDTSKDGKPAYVAPVAVESKTKYEIPENFYEMIEVARKMKADFPTLFEDQFDDKGYFKAVPFCWDSTENMFITLLENAGVPYTNGEGTNAAERYLWNSQEAKDIVIQLKKWNNEGLICTQNQLPITNEQKGYHEYSSNMAVKGQIFMCVSSTAGARYFAEEGGFLASMNHGLNWAEGTKAADAKVISQGPSLTFFTNKNEEVNKAAFDFYKVLTNAENSATLATKTSYFPLRASSYESEEVKNLLASAGTANAESASSLKNTDYTGQALKLNEEYTKNNNYYMSDAFDGSAQCRTAIGGIITDVFNNKDAKTDEQIKAAVDKAFDDAWKKLTA